MKNKRLLLLPILVLFSFLYYSFTPTNCNTALRNKCIKELTPYIHNGQLNSMSVFPGEKVSTVVSFYSGHKYRIVSCNDGSKNTYFEVKTTSDKVLYSSKGKESDFWDFSVTSTRNLIIDVQMEDESDNKEGCIGVVVGYTE